MENMCIVLGGYFNQSKIFWNAKGAHNVLGSLGIILKKEIFTNISLSNLWGKVNQKMSS